EALIADKPKDAGDTAPAGGGHGGHGGF
ncbi:MAG: hypothetical protein RJA70_3518, partial [Pseudomonadota bacterium]